MAKIPPRSGKPPKNVQRAIDEGNIEDLRAHLTPRQVAFVDEYLVDFNGTAAAIRAGCAPAYASRQASQILRKPGVRALLEFKQQSTEAKIVSVDPDYLLQRLHEIMTKEGAKDSDKLRAIELFMKHKGMFIERQEITGKDGGPLELEQRQRAEEDQAAVIARLRQMKKPDLKAVK